MANKQAQVLKDAMEAYIDSYSLSDLLAQLADVCNEKASFIEENWQDRGTARVWRTASAKLMRACNSVDV